MGDTDQETDPGKRVPTFVWFMLGVAVVVVFVGLVMMIGHHGASGGAGPPPAATAIGAP